MKTKEIYALVGVLVLLVIFVGWRATKETAPEVAGETQGETPNTSTNTGSTQVKRPSSSSVSKAPTSVNPTVVAEKPVPTVPTAKSLAGSTYKLTTYNGAAMPSDSKYTLSFTDASFTLKLCNTMSSSYYITSNMLKVNNLMSTAMYCGIPANIMQIETDASLMFNSGLTTIYKSGSTLILSHPNGIVMAFEGF